MAKFELDTAKGTTDIPPEEKIIKNEIVDKLKKIFENFGFNPLETPILERYDVLASKYAGGSEILKETFKLKDQGKRDLCLRYDLTVPFSRFVGMNKTMKMPFKRYEMGAVFRDGPIKAGRTRKFWQCDFDVVGVKSMIADAECIEIFKRGFKELSIDVQIKVSNRKVMNGMMKYCGLKKEAEQIEAILTVDKLEKVGPEGVKKELKEKKFKKEIVDKIVETISFKGKNKDKLNYLRDILQDEEGKQGMEEMQELLVYLKAEKDDKIVDFDISLARGLAYYTGTVFEVTLDQKLMKIIKFYSTLASGGRYDNMIGNFLQSKQEYPAVGGSFGLVPIMYVLEEMRKKESKTKQDKLRKTVVDLFILPIGVQKECLEIANKLRDEGINVDMDLIGRGVSKNLNYADGLGIPYVLFVGEEELKKGKFKLKNMNTGDEKVVSLDKVKKEIRK